MRDIGFNLSMAKHGQDLTWRVTGHLGQRAALILSEISPALACWTPSTFVVALDADAELDPSAAAVLRPLLREAARRGAQVIVEGGSPTLRALLQPLPETPVLPYQRTGSPRPQRLVRLRTRVTSRGHDD